MRALALLELWYWRHQLGAIRRSPARALIWLVYVVFVAIALGGRALGRHAHATLPAAAFPLAGAVSTAIGGVVVAFAGAIVVGAAGGRAAGFRTPAEAVMVSNAGISPLAVATWLQVRALGPRSLRILASVVYFVALLAPVHGALPTGGIVLRCALAVIALVGLTLPVFLASRTAASRRTLGAAGWLAIAAGIGALVAGFVVPARFAPVAAAGLDPGELARAIVSGAPLAYLVPALAILVELAAVRSLAADALPELYASSVRSNAAVAGRHPDGSAGVARAGARTRVPAGAAAILWKNWASLRHEPAGLRTTALVALGATAIGIAAGAFARRTGDATFPTLCLALEGFVAVLFGPLGASQKLAVELGQPLFWLGRAPLRARIEAWTLAFAWRGALALGLVQAGLGIGSGDALLAAGGFVATAVAYGSLVAFGVGLFALFPAPIDARGPLALLRLVATGLYLVPAVAVGALASAFATPDPLAIGLAVAMLGCQGWLAVALAARRFRQRGATFAALGRAR